MNANFHYYRSELKSKNILRYKFIGIVSEIILSGEIFDKNENIVPFIQGVFDVNYKDYVFLSRTTIVARTTRLINDMSEKEYEAARKSLQHFVSELMSVDGENNVSGRTSSLSKWIEGILNEE